MTIDPKTLAALQYQGRRMAAALAENDQKEADLIQRRVDQLLDGRPAAVGETDGEVIYDNADTWLQAQVTDVVNNTGKPESVLDSAAWEALNRPFALGNIDGEHPDDRGEPNGGGVGLLDRPKE